MSNPGTDPSGAAANVNVDPDEVARFAALAERWWDAHGAFKPLHQIGPARLAFIRDSIVEALGIPRSGLHPLKGMRLVDIGSGGGLVSEPLARLGATVTGIDLAAESVAAARAHAEAGGLSIDYRVQSIEELAASGERFDAAGWSPVGSNSARIRNDISPRRRRLRPLAPAGRCASPCRRPRPSTRRESPPARPE